MKTTAKHRQFLRDTMGVVPNDEQDLLDDLDEALAERDALRVEVGMLREKLSRVSPLANAGHGRDLCGINHDELIQSATEDLRAEVDVLHAELDLQMNRVASARQGVVNELAAEAEHALENAKALMKYEADEGRARELSAMTLRNLVSGMAIGDTVENNLRAEVEALKHERDEARGQFENSKQAYAESLDALVYDGKEIESLRAKVERLTESRLECAGCGAELEHSIIDNDPAYRRILRVDECPECSAVRDNDLRRIDQALARVKVMTAALVEIKSDQGRVCSEFETCKHPACQSSYASWCIADEALKRVLDEEGKK